MSSDLCRHTASVGALRTLCVALLTGAAVVMMGWMYMERGQVERCTKQHVTTDPPATPLPVRVIIEHQQQKLAVQSVNNTGPVSTRPPWDYNWDRKASSDGSKAPSTRTLILVRHGQYDLSTGRLTEKGRSQANMTGIRLRALNIPYDRIIHSTLIRAEQTAQLVHAHLADLPMTSDDMIQEGGPMPPQPTVSYWGLPERNYFVDSPRLEAAYRKYFYRADKGQTKNSYTILVGHGNIFRFFALRALQFPPEAWMRVFIAHASISVLHLNADSTVSMDKFGDSGHFPPDLVTY